MEYSQEDLQRFKDNNGMSLDEAWQKVNEWSALGKNQEAMQGCEEIIKIFPEHEAKDLLEKLKTTSEPTDTLEASNVQQEAIPGISENVQQMGREAAQKVTEGIDQVKKRIKEGRSEEEKQKAKERIAKYEQQIVEAKNKELIADEKLFAALSYISVLFLLPLLFKKESVYAQFHGKQGMVLFIILYFCAWLIITPIVWIFSRTLLAQMIHFLAVFFAIIVSVTLAFIAYRGTWLKIPGVFGLSKKIP